MQNVITNNRAMRFKLRNYKYIKVRYFNLNQVTIGHRRLLREFVSICVELWSGSI